MLDSLAWEAWEEEDVISGCRTLFVTGEIETNLYKPVLRRKELPGLPLTNLLLEITSPTVKRAWTAEELIYSECICDRNNYTCITIYLGHRVIAEMGLEIVKIY
jgi:hypothetical protein